MKFHLFFLFILGCTLQGPKTKDKSFLNKLNGNNYHSDVSTAISPLSVQRVQRNTTISGTCFFKMKNDDFKYPVKFKEIHLLKNGQLITKASTDQQGHFKLNSMIEDGRYRLSVNGPQYVGEIQIEVSGYFIQNLNFEVNKI